MNQGAAVVENFPPLFFYPLILVFGLILGSFNSVLVARIPKNESFGIRSRCSRCDAQIQSSDKIPIFGYIRLRGKCRNCQQPFSPRYFLLELSTATGLFIPFFLFDRFTMVAAWVVFIILGVALSAIDFQLHRLPDVLNLALYLAGLALLALDAMLNDRLDHLGSAVIASLLLSALYLLLNLLSKGGMGMGDVKLAASIGLYTGYISAQSVYVATMTSFALGGVVGITVMLLGKGSRKTRLPFGPFMIAGAVISSWLTPLIWTI